MVAKSLLPNQWALPEEITVRLGERAGRQRAMFADGHLLLIIHWLPQENEHERDGRLYWRRPDGSWKADRAAGDGWHALVRHVDAFEEAIEKLDERERAASTAGEYFRLLNELGPIFRSARNLSAALQQARELCRFDRAIINLRDRMEEIARTAELVHGDAQNGLEFALARQAEAQARHSHRMALAAHRLNMLVAFFFPIATLCSVFGMSLSHGMEKLWAPVPFLSVVVIGLVAGQVLRAVFEKDVDVPRAKRTATG